MIASKILFMDSNFVDFVFSTIANLLRANSILSMIIPKYVSNLSILNPRLIVKKKHI